MEFTGSSPPRSPTGNGKRVRMPCSYALASPSLVSTSDFENSPLDMPCASVTRSMPGTPKALCNATAV
eukprot:CAMPEP_0172740998 /NCGR_PEP_ID=MMETSP1074-20121228/126125_1 /TAXON_ID=2916 /ORGANISM="Ceratium fusus, Strain PA161109" /LENGTH=67 /DNA_ID=CAMNT_0013571235 /DNA_START=293 /DNA_END=493 /DNA_ORIENTATION=+